MIKGDDQLFTISYHLAFAMCPGLDISWAAVVSFISFQLFTLPLKVGNFCFENLLCSDFLLSIDDTLAEVNDQPAPDDEQ